MSKPDKVKVWEWATGKQAHFHHDFWWDKDDLVDAELVQGCTWLSDVLDGMTDGYDGMKVERRLWNVTLGGWMGWKFAQISARWTENPVISEKATATTLPEALIAACLKYMEAK